MTSFLRDRGRSRVDNTLYSNRFQTSIILQANTALSDTFTGTTLDVLKWDTYLIHSGTVTQNDNLLCNTVGPAHCGAKCFSVESFEISLGFVLTLKWKPHHSQYSSGWVPSIRFRAPSVTRETVYYGECSEKYFGVNLARFSVDTTARTRISPVSALASAANYQGTAITLDSGSDVINITAGDTAWHDIYISYNPSTRLMTVKLDGTTLYTCTVSSATISDIGSVYKLELSTSNYGYSTSEQFDDVLLVSY